MDHRIHLLGRVLIEMGDSAIEERDLPGRRGRIAFAFLVLARHRTVPAEELAAVVWHEEPPATWEQDLGTLISRLQAVLDRSELTGRGAIRGDSDGYQLSLTDVWIDADVAVAKLEEARRAIEVGDAEKARRAATTAAEITARSFLSGEEGPWIDLQRDRFREVRTQALEILAEPERRAAAAQQPHRVVRTFMFTDIVGSTKLVELVGDDAWSDLVKWHDRTLRGFFETHDGEEIDHAGDGFFIAFPDRERACACAVEIQRRLAEQRKSQGFAPKVRIGLHSAEVNAGDGFFSGKGVHEAARIAALAEGGQIVASSITAEHLAPERVADTRKADLKGVSQPIEVVTLLWDQ